MFAPISTSPPTKSDPQKQHTNTDRNEDGDLPKLIAVQPTNNNYYQNDKNGIPKDDGTINIDNDNYSHQNAFNQVENLYSENKRLRNINKKLKK